VGPKKLVIISIGIWTPAMPQV